MAEIVPPTQSSLRRAAGIIRRGGLVAFPTETVYGLGASALDPTAAARIFAAKGRPATNPLIVHIATTEELADLVEDRLDSRARQALAVLTSHFWPGPLTLVLPKKPAVPDIVTAGGPTVAVRMPRHPVALALIAASGVPLAAPSANRSEQLSPTRAEHVAASLGEAVDLILDDGPAEVGLESTVLDLTDWPPRLLRPGMITAAEIEAVVDSPILRGGGDENALRSPGQLPRHYAPRTPLRLAADIREEARRTQSPTAILAYSAPAADWPAHAQAIVLPDNPSEYAAGLYDALHRLDRSGASLILVEAVPDTDEWLAIRDRLRRAAAA